MSADKFISSLMDICHLKNSELEPQYQKYKGPVVLRGVSVNINIFGKIIGTTAAVFHLEMEWYSNSGARA